ncbi:hypothetical protein SH661x_000315 [Planctomicrobium sp. SH661]|uniref:hypothetical protein n=1 Tax=Planctomicrobium sp. SH661 TaxID=3448124 RepID=UPI003F5B0896
MPRTADDLKAIPHGTAPVEVSDTEWLSNFEFRHGAPRELSLPARRGDVSAFAEALPGVFEEQCRIGKRERVRLLASLATLWNQSVHSGNSPVEQGSLARCLFDTELTQDELSGRIEAIMASTSESIPDPQTLVAAHWLLRMSGRQLETQTLFTFFRWTVEASQSWLKRTEQESPANSNPESGCDAFDFLEIELLNTLIFPGLKGCKKQLRQSAKAWRKALDAITDTDGTPHARWLNEILPRFCQLAALTLFADSLNERFWDRKSHRRLEGLLARTSLLLTPRHVGFSEVDSGAACKALLTAADVLHLSSRPGLLTLLTQWEDAAQLNQVTSRREIRGKLPKTSIQTDWGDWACLRSGWQSPVDACYVRHDGETPQLELIAADLPLLAGAWSHELKINGTTQKPTGEWTCCCWYLDRQAAFVELQLDRESPIQVIRQALLLREESVLMLADSIRVPESSSIEFQRSVPLAGSWGLEEDVLSREINLCQGNERVRVFPWSGPQMRLDRSDESTSVRENQLQVHARTQGHGLYVATLLDWSAKRREAPIDWQRVTVAEDGQILAPEIAVGHRLRIGKKQWVLYHSHRKPAFPRSVLGVHTLSESVFGRLDSDGEVEILVEVEL